MASEDKRFVRSRELVLAVAIIGGMILWVILLQNYYILLLGLADAGLFYIFYKATFRLKESFKSVGDTLTTFNIIEKGIPRRPFSLRLEIFKDPTERATDIYKAFQENINRSPEDERQEYQKLIAGLEGFTLGAFYTNFNYILQRRIRRYLKIYKLYLSPSQERFLRYRKMLDDLWNNSALSDKEYAILETALQKYAETIEPPEPTLLDIVPEQDSINAVQLADEEIDGCKYAVLAAVQGLRDEDVLQFLYRLKEVLENLKTFPKREEIRLLQTQLVDMHSNNEWLWGKLEEMKKFKSSTQDRYNKLMDEED
jgi:hypothetical protein